MSGIEDASVDLVVTSPPYPMIEMWDAMFAEQDASIDVTLIENQPEQAFERMHRLLDSVWQECFRVMRPAGILCINIGDATRTIAKEFRLYSNHSRILQSCLSLGLRNLPNIIWRKQTNAPNKFMGSGMLPAGAYVTLEHEYILIFRKEGKRLFNNVEGDCDAHNPPSSGKNAIYGSLMSGILKALDRLFPGQEETAVRPFLLSLPTG